MRIFSGTPTRYWLATAILLAVSTAALAASPEPGVAHELAVARAARVSDIRYRLSFV
ncbi:MAG: hypothetical protein QOH35_1190, partial [Acidobacteriaceae bacterium]|nr:hypothetical protein [Acidobacteriaceae bacterium]